MANIKGSTAGHKSTEFWLNSAGLLGGLLVSIGEQYLGASNPWIMAVGAILSAVCGAGYAHARASVKQSLAAASMAEKAIEVGKPTANKAKI